MPALSNLCSSNATVVAGLWSPSVVLVLIREKLTTHAQRLAALAGRFVFHNLLEYRVKNDVPKLRRRLSRQRDNKSFRTTINASS